MSSLSERIAGCKIDRRSFLAATGASVAGLALAGCSPQGNALQEADEEVAAFESEGKWVPAACWLNCGGRCYNAAYVVDGVVKYQKTDDTHEDSVTMPQQRGCTRGRSQRYQVYAPDRIKYPMKRKNWSPGNPNGHLRGIDEWERISWDEALDYVASEMQRIRKDYGDRAILNAGFANTFTDFYYTLYALGGATTIDDTSSTGTYQNNSAILGLPPYDVYVSNDRWDLLNSDTIVIYGGNPVWASPGNPNYYLMQAKEAGVQFVCVGPSHNASADLFDARWIPVRPGTDMAFLLAVAYVMITEDDPESNPMIDWDFLDRCTVGFDAEHMPENAALNENFKDYVLGAYDGMSKTPEWATEICGTPVEDIEWFAREMSMEKKVALLHSYAPARCNNAQDFPQIFMTIGAMGGHFGLPGHATGTVYHVNAGNSGPSLVKGGSIGEVFEPMQQQVNAVDDVIMAPDLWEAVLNGKYLFQQNAYADLSSVEERDIDIRLIYTVWRNSLQTIPGTMKGIEAYRKVECVVNQGYDFNLSARYSDIVLPAITQWERMSYYSYLTATGREFQLYPSKVIEPLWEAKDDVWIGEQLLERCGIDPATVYPASREQGYFNFISSSTVINEAGTDYEPLVTITQEDIDEWGVEGKPQEGRISLTELLEKGVYQVERKPDDNYGHIEYKEFREDPEANPRNSASGKLEIYCQVKADAINAMGRSTAKPYPTYIPMLHGYEESFADWGAKTKGKYPYQMYNPHYLRRGHTGFDNVPQLREVWPNPAFISAQDAAEKGIKTGDTILITNDFGKALRHASVTERIMPGCVALPHGSWTDLDEETQIDKAGADNVMLPQETSGDGVSGYNTVLVDFVKWGGEELPPDCEKVYQPAGNIE